MKDLNLRTTVRPANAHDGALSKSKPVDSVDLIVNLFEKALNSKGPVIKSKFAVDPVNGYIEEAFNIKVSSDNPKHPLDEFYDSLLMELSICRPFVKPSRPLDMVNALAGKSFAPGGPSNESRQKVEKLLGFIKELYYSFNNSSDATDPGNDLIKRAFGIANALGNPKHTFEEVTDLIKKSLGQAYSSIKPSGATDMINDFIAVKLGGSLPSVENMSSVQSKLLEATNQLAYKLTVGSEEYNNKAKEIEKMKETRKKLQDNLNQLDS